MSLSVLDFVSPILLRLLSRNPTALPRLPRFMKFPKANTTSRTCEPSLKINNDFISFLFSLENLFQFLAGFEFFAREVNSFNLWLDIFQTIVQSLLEEQGLETLGVARNPERMEEIHTHTSHMPAHTHTHTHTHTTAILAHLQ